MRPVIEGKHLCTSKSESRMCGENGKGKGELLKLVYG